LIAELPRQAFGVAEIAEAALELSEWEARRGKVEVEINGLLQRLVGFRQMGNAANACSKHATASWWADRAKAFAPA
jgi:hypothetical protein